MGRGLLKANTLSVNSMAVRNDWQLRGLGSRVLKSFEQIAADRSMPTVEIFIPRKLSVPFYIKNGYTAVGKPHADGTPHKMTKDITSKR